MTKKFKVTTDGQERIEVVVRFRVTRGEIVNALLAAYGDTQLGTPLPRLGKRQVTRTLDLYLRGYGELIEREELTYTERVLEWANATVTRHYGVQQPTE